ncbi:MAG: hypothetical protein QOG03_1125 [Actinomycetota bacterium]|jgi:uncharacterized HhH-GPD family protein|nr:hypothetical protein [Actinomycetota bacterium]
MAAKLALSQDADADQLLSEDPLALLIGMVLDQQIPLEWAFKGPYELKQRLGKDLDAADLASMDPEVLAKSFAERPALHRYPGSMAKRVHELAQQLVEDYDGEADKVWTTAKTGEQLYRNLKRLPGFGEQKARIFLALLAKQLGVKPQGWKDQAGDYGRPGTFMSVADITSPDSLLKVREYKQQKKAAAKAAQAAKAEQP